jgi:hypothetical protein
LQRSKGQLQRCVHAGLAARHAAHHAARRQRHATPTSKHTSLDKTATRCATSLVAKNGVHRASTHVGHAPTINAVLNARGHREGTGKPMPPPQSLWLHTCAHKTGLL